MTKALALHEGTDIGRILPDASLAFLFKITIVLRLARRRQQDQLLDWGCVDLAVEKFL